MRQNHWRACCGVLQFFLFVLPCVAVAQALAPGDQALQRQQEQLRALREQQDNGVDVQLGTATAVDAGRLPEEVPCRRIDVVRIDSADGSRDVFPLNTQIGWASALKGPDGNDPPQRRCLGTRGIALLAERLTNALVAAGHITSRVELPPQDLADGELVLHIRPGKVGKIRLSTQPPVAVSALALHTGKVLNLRDIEQTLENLRRVSGAEADIQVSPGAAAGDSDIDIVYVQGFPLRLNLSIDNAGSRTTGRWQGATTLAWDNPVGLADTAYLSLGRELGDKQPGARGSRYHVLHYSVPYGPWLLGFTSTRSQYHQTIVGAFQSYLYEGRSHSDELALSRVLRRGGASKTTLSLTAFARRSRNFIEGTEVEVQRRRTGGWILTLDHLHHLGMSILDAQVNYRRGTGAFGAQSAPEEPFGEGTSRMQLLQGTIDLHTSWRLAGMPLTYRMRWRGQWNYTALTPQDRLCVGGRHTVRGTDGEQSLCGERGQVWRNEIFAPWPALVGGAALARGTSLQIYAAIDIGRVGGPSTVGQGTTLAGTALGVRWATPAALLAASTSGVLQLDAFLARPIRRPPGFTTASATAGLSVNLAF